MTEEVRIIPAEEKHLEAAADIAVAAWTPIREIFRRDLGDEIYNAIFTGWQKAKREGVIAGLKRGGFVAVIGEKVVGFITYSLNEKTKTGEISGNAVDPETRGKGIGPKMYEFILNKMREAGMVYATVNTGLDDGHAPARRAYGKAGFEKNLPSIRYYQKLQPRDKVDLGDIEIVPATEAHLEAAGDIAVAAWTPIRAVFRRDLGDEIYESQFTGWEQPKRDAVCDGLRKGGYVALLDGKVVGFITYSLNQTAKFGEITGTAVDPDIRGKGIGPKMGNFILSKMYDEGMLYACVSTGLDDGHAPARRAYEKMGYKENLPSIRYYQKL